VKGNLTAMVWKDRQDMHIMTNTCRPPREGNFFDEQEKAEKLVIVRECSQYMGYVDKGDRMANRYSIGEHESGQKFYFPTSWT
jgi:hypothetical protein